MHSERYCRGLTRTILILNCITEKGEFMYRSYFPKKRKKQRRQLNRKRQLWMSLFPSTSFPRVACGTCACSPPPKSTVFFRKFSSSFVRHLWCCFIYKKSKSNYLMNPRNGDIKLPTSPHPPWSRKWGFRGFLVLKWNYRWQAKYVFHWFARQADERKKKN